MELRRTKPLNVKGKIMVISIGSDHRGFQVKAKLIQFLQDNGHQPVDEGTNDCESVDYPDIAQRVGTKVSCGSADRGILICGTGIGMAITANKFKGVRAATCHDEVTAELSRRHNDCNVLCLSGDMLAEAQIDRLVEVWLNTEFDGGRHGRRVEKIAVIEAGQQPCGSTESE